MNGTLVFWFLFSLVVMIIAAGIEFVRLVIRYGKQRHQFDELEQRQIDDRKRELEKMKKKQE
jgi:uncharacterized membrane-anchored protein YhcB (DUF1043 family)